MLKGLNLLSDQNLRLLRNRLAAYDKLSDQRLRDLLQVRREYERRYGLNVHMPQGDREEPVWGRDVAQD